MHFYGECYGRTQKEIVEVMSKRHIENKCVGDQTYKKCDKSKHDHCTGLAHAEAIYTFKSKTTEESKYRAVKVLGLSHLIIDMDHLVKIISLFHLGTVMKKEGYRCFNWPDCTKTGDCTESKKAELLNVLKEKCLKDSKCVAVSCYDPDGVGSCSRYMLSKTCDKATWDDQEDWSIHLIKSGITLTFLYIFLIDLLLK